MLILTTVGELDRRTLAAVWVVPLIFSFFNTSLAQLFFPSMPRLMDQFLKIAVDFSAARYALLSLTVIAWLVAGWLSTVAESSWRARAMVAALDDRADRLA